jgi:uncharacterized protein YkwD
MMCSRVLGVVGTGVVVATLLTACVRDPAPSSVGEPAFYRSMASNGTTLDAATAASMISGYRSNNGLSVVSLDPRLMSIAEAQARAMAARDKLDHDVARDVTGRLRASGYVTKSAGENISAGYHTLAEAFSGWRDSPPHRKNMLLPEATQMGIAAAYAPGSKYKVFWALILAAPDNGRG